MFAKHLVRIKSDENQACNLNSCAHILLSKEKLKLEYFGGNWNLFHIPYYPVFPPRFFPGFSSIKMPFQWPSGLPGRACCMRHGRSWVWTPNLHQCLQTHLQVRGSKRLSCHADFYTVSRCHTRGQSQEFIACRQQSTQVRDPPWLWNPGETLPEVQNRGISGPTKRSYVLQKLLKILKKIFSLT